MYKINLSLVCLLLTSPALDGMVVVPATATKRVNMSSSMAPSTSSLNEARSLQSDHTLSSVLAQLHGDETYFIYHLPNDIITLINNRLKESDQIYQECEIMSKALERAKAQEIPDFKNYSMKNIEGYFSDLINQILKNKTKEEALLAFITCQRIFWYLVNNGANVDAPIKIIRYYQDQPITFSSTFLTHTIEIAVDERAYETDRTIGLAIVKRLIMAGASINVYDPLNTPLTTAAREKPSEAAKKDYQNLITELMKAKADATLPNWQGKNPLFIAIERNNDVIMPFLLQNRALLNTRYKGYTPLAYAREVSSSSEIKSHLLRAGAQDSTLGERLLMKVRYY